MSAAPIHEPGTLLIKNDDDRKANPTSRPIIGATARELTQAPTMPVPMGSAAAAAILYLLGRILAAKPTKRAPNILPGKANKLPVPMRFLIRLVTNAAARAQKGPSAIPAITLIAC